MLADLRFLNEFKFNVPGAPVPWSSPDIGMAVGKNGRRHRFAKKNPALIAWQLRIAYEARRSYGPYEPHVGPVYLATQFVLESDEPERFGELVIPAITWIEDQAYHKRQGGLPDQSNLVKAVEDALQGVFFVNDTQVRARSDSCLWGPEPGCRVLVGFLDPARPGVSIL